ncbi:MAG: PDDEXK nuclease domain-containing protein [Planctomycetota bacterium]|nr:PDDEXK nuclease domain-containing protein [Planctomycetota bacterium]
MARKTRQMAKVAGGLSGPYESGLQEMVGLLEAARRRTARAVNGIMTMTYWEIGRRIVEYEQHGADRARYGDGLIARLSEDLKKRFGRGYSRRNVEQMRLFYLSRPKAQTMSAESGKTPTGLLPPQKGQAGGSSPNPRQFALPWSHYVRLLGVEDVAARAFYEDEALAGGWSVRQLDRQIGSQFYERTMLSRNKKTMLEKGSRAKREDAVSPDEEIKDPFVLEFLNLKDEYSEHELEEALIRHLETFLLELGSDFAFVARQRRLRIGNKWARVDLLLYHRRLRCLVIIELKLTEFAAGDVGQMNMYLNYAKAHWTHADENPPVGLILCATKDEQMVRYAIEGLGDRVHAAAYATQLPSESALAAELVKAREILERRRGRAEGS